MSTPLVTSGATPVPALAFLLVFAGGELTHSGSPCDLTWSAADGGGQMFSTGGAYTLGGTAGQPDSGTSFLLRAGQPPPPRPTLFSAPLIDNRFPKKHPVAPAPFLRIPRTNGILCPG